MNVILAILISLSALVAPAQAPINEDDYMPPLPIEEVLGMDWVRYELGRSGAPIAENITVQLTNDPALNCGAELSTVGQGGCTHWLPNGTVLIVVSPALEWTAWGQHILHHELGHAMLETYDECAAESYAHGFTQIVLWSYPQCTTAL